MRIKAIPLLAAIAIIFTGLAVPVFATENDPWTVTVTVDECTVTISPSGRTAYYEDSEGRTGGPIHKPDTVTLDFTSSGWVDVRLIHRPGDDDGVSVTKRFDIPGPCDETTTTGATTTTGGTSSTTQPGTSTSTSSPETTTTAAVTTTTAASTTTTLGGTSTTTSTLPTSSSTTLQPTTTTTVLITTTTIPTASTTSSVPPIVTTTTGPGSSTTVTSPASSTVPPSTPTTEPVTDTTIVTSTLPDCTDDEANSGECSELPNTGMSAAQVFTIAVVALIAGVAILGASTVFGVWKEAKR